MSIKPLSNLNSFKNSFSSGCALAGNLLVNSSKADCQFGHTRKTVLFGALIRKRSSGLVSRTSYRGSECSRNLCLGRTMAASGSKVTAAGDIIVDNLIPSFGSVSSFTKCNGVNFDGGRHRGSRRATVSMTYREPRRRREADGYFIYDVTPITQRLCSSDSSGGLWSKKYSSSSLQVYTDGVESSVLLNASSCDEQFSSLSIAADEKSLADKSLKLQSGSCYMPHPDKEKTGGEDAHFICVEEQVIGVADGVGGWADVGIDAGEYARGLMLNSVKAIQDEPKGCIDPVRVLTKAHSDTKVQGSSTACIIALTDQQVVHAINLGDSGFIVIRDGCTVFQSGVQQHGFNFPYQLENGVNGDLPSSGQVFSFLVAPGDVIVAGTDGLFDNLFDSDITAVVAQGMKADLSPQTTAQKIAALARERALDRRRQTPFSKAALEAGFHYFGGKLDDLTVVVSYLSNSTDM